jgi:hypothetical protein
MALLLMLGAIIMAVVALMVLRSLVTLTVAYMTSRAYAVEHAPQSTMRR